MHPWWIPMTLYFTTMCMVRTQFKPTVQEECGHQAISVFTITTWMRDWFVVSLLAAAPLEDPNLLQTLSNYLHDQITKDTTAKSSGHLCYLSEDQVTLEAVWFRSSHGSERATVKIMGAQRWRVGTPKEIEHDSFQANNDTVGLCHDTTEEAVWPTPIITGYLGEGSRQLEFPSLVSRSCNDPLQCLCHQ